MASRNALFESDGPEALRALARVFDDHEDGRELRKGLLKQLRNAGKPTAAALQAATVARLPSRGGARDSFKRPKYSIRTRLTGVNASVRIQSSKGHTWAALEQRGQLRHPVFPRDRPRAEWTWVGQRVPTLGVQAAELDEHLEEFRDGILTAINETADQIAADINKIG
jgi:hypothetical protein